MEVVYIIVGVVVGISICLFLDVDSIAKKFSKKKKSLTIKMSRMTHSLSLTFIRS